jgi:hypothetical protein
LLSLQGGTTSEYYHLTNTEHGYVSGVNAQSVLTTASPSFEKVTVNNLSLDGNNITSSLGNINLVPNNITTTAKQIESTLATGTTPFIITSTTKVPSLNVEQVDSADLSTDTALGISNVLIPSQNAVKTYVDRDYKGVAQTSSVMLDWTDTWTTYAVANSIGEHNDVVNITDSTNGHSGYKSITATGDVYVSSWIYLAQTNSVIRPIELLKETGGLSDLAYIYFNSDGTIHAVNVADNTIGTYTANTWVHVCMRFVKNTASYVYLNGNLVDTQTVGTANNDVERLRIYKADANAFTIYTDAYYYGSSFVDSFASFWRFDSAITNYINPYQSFRLIPDGTNMRTVSRFTNYFGTDHSNTNAALGGHLICIETGSYKIAIKAFSDTASRTKHGHINAGAAANSANWESTTAMDITFTDADTDYTILSSAKTLTKGDSVYFYYYVDQNDGTGLMFIKDVYLVRQ